MNENFTKKGFAGLFMTHPVYPCSLFIYKYQSHGNILIDYMCPWRRCRVNNSGLNMFDIGFSETKCLQVN